MKKLHNITLLFIFSLLFATQTSTAQNHTSHNVLDIAKGGTDTDGQIIDAFNKQLVFDADSIKGFDEESAIKEAKLYFKKDWEIKRYVAVLKRNFIDFKYGFSSIAPLPTPQAPCTNPDFETGTLAGWVTKQGPNNNSLTMAGCCPNATGQIVTVTPGADPNIAALQRVPTGGGNYAARIGHTAKATGGVSYRLSQQFDVTPINSAFLYKYAVVLNDGGHSCSEQPFFNITFRDCAGNLIPCGQLQVAAQGSSCSNGSTGFVSGGGTLKYLDWQTRSFDLTAYIGSCVEIEFTVAGCIASQAGHGGYAYVDASCQPMTLNLNNIDIPVGQTNSYICASTTNTLCAPEGFTSYNWTGPGVTGQVSRCVAANVSGTYSVTLGMAGSSCNSPVLYSNFSIVTAPTANFNFTATPCQSTFTVPFVDNSNQNAGPPITNYQWTWDDATANGTNPTETHTFPSVGTRNVKLKIANGACFDSITKVVTINSKPVANFNTQNNCLGVASTFTSVSTPTAGIAAQVWKWGDATGNGSGTTSSHTYGSANTYSVKLVVTSVDLCKDSIVKTIVVNPRPVITFTANPVCLGSASSFNNTSTISAPQVISNWAWDFDNNGTADSNGQSPTNTYTTSGSYTVKLKGTSAQGCADSLSRTIKVNASPTATFTPANACINLNVALNNASSIALPDNISAYNWNFGANSTPATSSNSNPPSLTYNASGIKTIVLNITANTSCTATITRTVEVYANPVASFSASSVCQSTATAYTDLSTPTGSITGWDWDYTNNNSVDNSAQNPSFTFPASGTFSTSLVVTSNFGCKHTVVLPVNVWGHSIPDFSPGNVCFGTSTLFTNNTNTINNANVGSVATYDWDFADGSPISNTFNPSHSYTLGGNANAVYNVTLTATTTNNCVDTKVKAVKVFAVPTASFTANDVCLGSPTTLVDASNGNGNILNGYMWDFLSDGSVDVTGVSNPNFIFPAIGVNLVTYTVSTTPVVGLTCSNTTNTITVFVNPNPVPNFTFLNRCINEQPISFDASSSTIAMGANTGYAWAYGNGLTNVGINTTHTYATPAVYNATLIVTSDKGCQKAVVKPVTVYPKPIMNILNSQACDKNPVAFTGASLAGSGTVTQWYWDFNSTIASFEAQGENVNYVFPAPGDHVVTLVSVTDNGCRDTIVKPFYVDYVPVPQFSVNKPNGCPEHCVIFTDLTPPITGPGQNATWKWVLDDGSVVSNNSGATQAHCYNNSSSSQLALYDVKLVVTTDRGCSDSLTKPSFITVFPEPIANYDATPNPGNVVTPFVQFINQSSDYTKLWWWFGDNSPLDTVNINPGHLYSDVSANTYSTSLIVQNQYGCRDTAYLRVEISPEYTFYIPNAFTPSEADNVNSIFTGKGIGIDKYEMWIFDRWGEMIFYTNDIAKGWDGKVQGKPLECKQDVYVWKVKIKDVLGKKHDYVGHVTLLR